MSRPTRVGLALVAGFGAFAALVMLASLPTGTDRPEEVVPSDARLAARADIGDAVVLLLSRNGQLSIDVAYPGPKGWLSVSLPPERDAESAERSTVAARVSTEGGGGVPTLSAAYGSVSSEDDGVIVSWADGTHQRTKVGADGSWLLVRPRVSGLSRVQVLRDGEVVAEVGKL